MPGKLVGKAFKISENDARSYRYARPMRSNGGGMRPNGGVTHIAAINGPGSYASMRAREAMGSVPRARRIEQARQALPQRNTMKNNRRSPSPAQMAARKRFAQMARSGAFHRNEPLEPMPTISVGRGPVRVSSMRATARGGFGPAVTPRRPSGRSRQASWGGNIPYGRPGGAPGPAEQRRSSFRPPKKRGGSPGKSTRMRSASSKVDPAALARAVAMIEAGKYPIGKGITNAVRAAAQYVVHPRKSSSAKRASAKRASAKRRSTKRPSAKRASAKRPSAKRASAKRPSAKPRSRKAAAKKAAATRAANKAKRSAAAKKAARTRKRNAAKAVSARTGRTRKPAKKGKTMKRNAKRRSSSTRRRSRRSPAQLAAARRNIKKAQAALRKYGVSARRARRHVKGKVGKRTVARARPKYKSTKRMVAALRRRASGFKFQQKRRRSRRSVRRNEMRPNQMGSAVMSALKLGGTIALGFTVHKALTHLLNTVVFDAILTPAVASAAAASSTSPVQAAQGVGDIATIARSTLGGGSVAVLGVMLTNMLVKDQQTKQLVAGGMVASFVHGLLVTALEGLVPSVAPMLSGDGTAARLSAMSGAIDKMGIGPRFAAIQGMGEFFATNVSSTDGLGEYFESGVSGLGNYTGNPDIYQAAAGYGDIYQAAAGYGAGYGDIYQAAAGYGSNHIDPSSNLEHELSVAEAAAGVGEYFESGVSGFGDVASLPSQPSLPALPTAQTWIPGQSNPQLWAGMRSIDRDQSATAMVPAGVLQTSGGAGILG